MPDYIYSDDEQEMADLEEMLGRGRARRLGLSYPMPGRNAATGALTVDPQRVTPFYKRFARTTGDDPDSAVRQPDGVIEIDDEIEAMLADGGTERVRGRDMNVAGEIASKRRTDTQLPQEWQDDVQRRRLRAQAREQRRRLR